MKKPSGRLSQCMIVKNEEKNIEKALSWGKGIVCEQIVADTGSTDRTVEIAERMGAKVVHFTWVDDFSAAKNFAIEQASGDWIAFLDADEYFSEEDAAKLLPMLEKLDSREAQGGRNRRRADFIRTKWVHLQEDGSIMGVSVQDRIFRNDPTLRYRYRIHEELCRVADRGTLQEEDVHLLQDAALLHYDAQEELAIYHTGYGRQTGQGEKGERNARLLRQDVRDNPQDAARLMYLGDACASMEGKQQEALDCYRKILWEQGMKVPDSVVYLRAGLQMMSLLQNDPTEKTAAEYARIVDRLSELKCETHPDVPFFLGLQHAKCDRMEEGAALFEEALALAEIYKGVEVVRMASQLALVNWVIAYAALIRGQLPKAVQFAVSSLRADRYCPEGLQILLQAFMIEHKPGPQVEPYWQFLENIYDMGNLKDLLFIRKMADVSGFAAIEDRAAQALPPEVRNR